MGYRWQQGGSKVWPAAFPQREGRPGNAVLGGAALSSVRAVARQGLLLVVPVRIVFVCGVRAALRAPCPVPPRGGCRDAHCRRCPPGCSAACAQFSHTIIMHMPAGG